MNTPTYRNDSDEIDQETASQLDALYLRDLPNINAVNQKLLVVFSGGNAMGKSTIAKLISAELHGLVLENDAIKRTIKESYPELQRDEYNKLTWQYSMDVYRRLSVLTKNGLVVRDGVIDWYHDRILPLFKEQGYELFIIGYNISLRKRKDLIIKRGDTPTVTTDKLLSLIPEHDEHISTFRKLYTPDVILTDDNLYSHSIVSDQIRKKLATMYVKNNNASTP